MNLITNCLGTAVVIAALSLTWTSGVGGSERVRSQVRIASCTNIVNGSKAYPNFTQRRGVTCRQARQIYKGAKKGLGSLPPGCRVGQTVRWRGWKIRSIGGAEGHRFSKGGRMFISSGGGSC